MRWFQHALLAFLAGSVVVGAFATNRRITILLDQHVIEGRQNNTRSTRLLTQICLHTARTTAEAQACNPQEQ